MTSLTDPLVLARFVHFTACAVAAGTAIFAVLAGFSGAAAIEPLKTRWTTMVRVSAFVALLSGAAWLVIVAAGVLDRPVARVPFDGGLWSVAGGTHFGRLALARLALAVMLMIASSRPHLRLALAVALLLLIAPSGHAGAQPGAAGYAHLAADGLHLIAAGAWLGGLPALAMVLGRARRDADASAAAARATARFSLLGIVCVSLLIASGLANTCFMLSSPRDLVTTRYGAVLAGKIALFLVMVAIAAINRLRLTARLPEPHAVRGLQRNSVVEFGLGLGVLLLAALLGTLTPDDHRHDGRAAISNSVAGGAVTRPPMRQNVARSIGAMDSVAE